jgi:hypothetical protein
MKIEEIKEKYKDEWVLLEISDEDEIGIPKEGEVIAHSKERDDIYKALRDTKGKYTYQFYTGKIPKEGYAVAFSS